MADINISADHYEINVSGVGSTTAWLKSLNPKIRAGLNKGLKNVGFLVQREARRRAPYKEGNLERSIIFQADDSQVKIFVPVNSPAGRYAQLKHDGIYRLGPGSRTKGPQVGPKYLSRAVSENVEKINSLLNTALVIMPGN